MFMDVMDAASIPGHEGYYATSNGEILSYVRPDGKSRPSRVRLDLPAKVLKHKDNGRGYKNVSLGRSTYRYVHRLVWMSFNGQIPDNLQVRHLNGKKSDNRLENLALGTQSINESDKIKHGTLPFGDRHVNTRVSDDNVVLMREAWQAGVGLPELSSRFSTIKGHAHAIVTGKSRKRCGGPTSMRRDKPI